jgi:tetratricopeptide (TPR) repeat protein
MFAVRRASTRLSLAAVSPLLLLALGCKDGDRTRTTVAAATVSTRPADTSKPASADIRSDVHLVAGSAAALEPAAAYRDAEADFRAGHYPEAADGFAAYTRSRPENPWGFYMLGLASWKAGNQGEALQSFDQALAIDPRHLKSLLNSSRVLLELDRPQETIDRVQSALAIEPQSGNAYRLLGRAHAQLGDVDSAEAAYRKAIAIDNRDAWAMNNLGLLYLDHGRVGDALPPLARATALKPSAPVFQNNLGQALEKSGYYVAAKTAYEAALTSDSTYAKASVGLGRVTGREDQPSFGVIDLDALGLSFQAQVQAWQDCMSEEDVARDGTPEDSAQVEAPSSPQ